MGKLVIIWIRILATIMLVQASVMMFYVWKYLC